MELVAEGLDLGTLASADSLLSSGDKGQLRLYIDKKLSDDELYRLENEICNEGVTLTEPIKQEAHIVFIGFQKASDPLSIIKYILDKTKSFVVQGWQLLVSIGIPWWVWAVGGTAVGALVIGRLARKK